MNVDEGFLDAWINCMLVDHLGISIEKNGRIWMIWLEANLKKVQWNCQYLMCLLYEVSSFICLSHSTFHDFLAYILKAWDKELMLGSLNHCSFLDGFCIFRFQFSWIYCLSEWFKMNCKLIIVCMCSYSYYYVSMSVCVCCIDSLSKLLWIDSPLNG